MEIYGLVRIEAPFEFLAVTRMELCQEAGKHVWLTICGSIDDSAAKAASDLRAQSEIEVFVPGKDGLLFSGLLVSVKLEYRGETEVVLEAVSRTILMDIEEKTRSFQKKDMNYTELMEEVIAGNGGDFMVREKRPDDIVVPFIQYRETDWQFLNRLASQYGCSLFAYAEGRIPQVYLGLGPDGDDGGTEAAWEMKKQMEDYLRFRKEGNIMEQDSLQCEVTSRMRRRIGDSVTCSGITFLIASVKLHLENGLLRYTYRLVQRKGLHTAKLQNPLLQGDAFTGTVLEVGAGRVKIHLNIDELQAKEDAYWYPFGRADWYCMPEIGSTAALCIPSDDEKDAYVIAMQRPGDEGNAKTQRPENKCMETAHGKELDMTPHSIRIAAASSSVWMEISDKNGIKIKSRKGIHLKAVGTLECRGRTVVLESGERILLRTGRTAIVLDDIVQVKG